jgi:hypothetical protein
VPFADVELTRTQFERVRAACEQVGREQAGRDPESLVYSHAVTVCCAASESELRRRAERLAAFAEVGFERAYLQVIDLDDIHQLELIAAEVMPRGRGEGRVAFRSLDV